MIKVVLGLIVIWMGVTPLVLLSVMFWVAQLAPHCENGTFAVIALNKGAIACVYGYDMEKGKQ